MKISLVGPIGLKVSSRLQICFLSRSHIAFGYEPMALVHFMIQSATMTLKDNFTIHPVTYLTQLHYIFND